MEQTLSIIASIVGIVGGVIGLLGSAREREGLRVADDGSGANRMLTWTGLASLVFRAVGGVAVILAGAAYLFARALYPEGSARNELTEYYAADDLVTWTYRFSAVAIVCGVVSFVLPIVLLHRAYGWLFASFTMTMGAIMVMFAFALRAAESQFVNFGMSGLTDLLL